MESTEISIVIPSFGGAATVSRATTSALSQAGGRVRAIFVIDDDCGHTRRILESLDDARIGIVSNQRPLGAPASRNVGLGLVDTPFVTFLDVDDFYEGDFLAPLFRTMAEQSSDIGFGPSVSYSPRFSFERYRIPNYRNQEDVFVKWLGRRINVNTAAVVWRTDYIRSIGGWDEKLQRNQDGEIALRSMLLGAGFAQSREGAGVWFDDRSINRITTRTDNLDSLLYIVDKFLEMSSPVVPDPARITACARYCLVIAHLAFSNGQDEVGARALEKRRSLGFADYSGDWRFVASAATRLIPKEPRLAFWSALRKSRDSVKAFRSKARRSR